ncbi:NAD-binding protein [Xylophilus rhododendri]|uniref:NAD-binding protein n=1 Tax=Xylophilus rhododendri TaxID=2697032 RepID=A0A857JA40_9BURK|nr:NAD(P)-dependent oxidoreductase [Xylophilus rhododendri]QHJ00881.1 NAD-binding protein [Xylophilus rhododendri]
MDKPRIALIGVGMMGHGIARNILKHGYALTVLEHAGNQPLDELKNSGARSEPGIPGLAAGADIVILCVTGTPQVEAVLLGEGGVLQAMRPGTIVIDCSTAIPTSTERLAAEVQRAGGRFLDTPMTRSPKEAAEGRLNLLVGGDAALFAECRPLLACFAENISHCGPVGAGHRMKLLHNFVSLGFVSLLAEAAACAQEAGVDTAVFVEVLGKGGGGGAALERVKPYLTTRDPSALRFTVANGVKDLGYYTTMAREAGAQHDIADSVLAALGQALDLGGPQALMPELVSLFQGAPATQA